jgi:hypothetical protein
MSALVRDRLFSFNNVFVLEKSLSAAAFPNPHRLELSLCRVEQKEWDYILGRTHRMDKESIREIFARVLFFRNGFTNCYALKNKSGFLAHIQWIVFPEENHLIESCYAGFFKPLAPYEIMIENAFTMPEFRGLGLLGYATRHLLNLGGKLGYKKATSYVRCEKFASLNEMIRLGFSIKRVVPEYRLLGFTRRVLAERAQGRHKASGGRFHYFAPPATGRFPQAVARSKGERQNELH